MQRKSFMRLQLPSLAENEAFARVVVAAFVSRLDPTLDEISDIKTAVSEAVTNAIIHGYENTVGLIEIYAYLEGNKLVVEIEDRGVGIENLEQARQPMFTSKPELERSGMGFTIMENFMDEMTVHSEKNKGTKVVLVKYIRSKSPYKEN